MEPLLRFAVRTCWNTDSPVQQSSSGQWRSDVQWQRHTSMQHCSVSAVPHGPNMPEWPMLHGRRIHASRGDMQLHQYLRQHIYHRWRNFGYGLHFSVCGGGPRRLVVVFLGSVPIRWPTSHWASMQQQLDEQSADRHAGFQHRQQSTAELVKRRGWLIHWQLRQSSAAASARCRLQSRCIILVLE